jgi:hypothetical protein
VYFCNGPGLPGESRPRGLNEISCPSASLCVASDGEGDIVTSTEPTGGPGDWSVAYVNHGSDITDNGGEQAGIESVSCPSVVLCWAYGDHGAMFKSEHPAGGASAWREQGYLPELDGQNPTFFGWHYGSGSAACPSVTRCVAVREGSKIGMGVEAIVMTPAGVWAPGVEVGRPGAVPSGISCPSQELCVVITTGGSVIVGQGAAPATTTQQTSSALRKTSQHITLAAVPKFARAGRSYEIKASSSARLRVSVVSKTPTVCRVVAMAQTFTRIAVRLRTRGLCKLLAKQAGNAQFKAAEARLAFRVKTG